MRNQHARLLHVASYDAAVEDVWPGMTVRVPSAHHARMGGIRPVQAGALVDGEQTRFRVQLGPLRPMWVARHYGVVPGEVFNDVMEKGPSVRGITNTDLFRQELQPVKSTTPSSGNSRSTL